MSSGARGGVGEGALGGLGRGDPRLVGDASDALPPNTNGPTPGQPRPGGLPQ